MEVTSKGRHWVVIGCRVWCGVVAFFALAMWSWVLADLFGIGVWELVWKGLVAVLAFVFVVLVGTFTYAAYEIGFRNGRGDWLWGDWL